MQIYTLIYILGIIYLLKEDGECCSKEDGKIHCSVVESVLSVCKSYILIPFPSISRYRKVAITLFFTHLYILLFSGGGGGVLFSWPARSVKSQNRAFGIFFNFIRTKMKGFYKAGCKYITNIFVVKEREIEIGLPTDVKHVAHIGWDGTAGAAPSWMNEFKTVPEFATASIGNSGGLTLPSPWSSQDIGESVEQHKTVSGRLKEDEEAAPPSTDAARGKHKRKKNRSKSSPRPGATIRSSRPKPKFIETNQNTTNIEVA